MIKGFINIQRSLTGYFTGADIHPTEESAKQHASKNTIGQIYIAFDTDGTKRTRDMAGYYEEKERKEDMAETVLQERVGEKSKRRSRKTGN